MKLTIVLATRGRPQLLIPTVLSTMSKVASDDTRMLIAIDDDDRKTLDALSSDPNMQALLRDDRVVPSVRPREDCLGAKYNRALTEMPADAYVVMVDYMTHQTSGFDDIIRRAAELFPDGIGVVYNWMANASFPQSNVVTHGLAEKMGFIYPPFFPFWFIDHWLDDMARLIDRISFADFKIDCVSRRPGTMELREPGFWGSFFDALAIVRRKCAHEIICSPDFIEPAWRKEILLRHHPLIEYRSAWVNEHLRQGNDAMERAAGAGPADARYLRVKARALAMLSELKAKEAA